MPERPLRPCAHPGCRELTRGGRCERHRAALDAEWDQRRDRAARRLYGPEWRAAREAFLGEHPFCECEACSRSAAPLPSAVVDHVKDHKGDPALFWDRSNWRAMSKPCHDAKTARTMNEARRADGLRSSPNRLGRRH